MSECACHAIMGRETSDKNPGTADQPRWPWGKSRDGADNDGWDIREEGEMWRLMTWAKQTHTVFIIPLSHMWCDHIWKCAVDSAQSMCVVQPKGLCVRYGVRVQNQSRQPRRIEGQHINLTQPEDARTSQRTCATFNYRQPRTTRNHPQQP